MPEELTFSKDYRGLWKAARKIGNQDTLDLIWENLCSEIGLSDAATMADHQSLGKLAAEMANRRDKPGQEAKKL
jgi:ferritin-like metal-binding protein YciE